MISRTLFSFLLLNFGLVVTVAVLRPVLAVQQSGETATAIPEVVVPTDPPSLPSRSSDASVAPEISMPNVSGTAPNAPANKMVLDEILKVIQDGRGELEVPPLNFPPLPNKSNVGSTKAELQRLSQRMKSIAQLTQSAQALIAEAQQLQAAGQADEARALTEHVQMLRFIIVRLATDNATDEPQVLN